MGGPKAAVSPYVREEWQFGLECDHVVVTPLLCDSVGSEFVRRRKEVGNAA